VAPAAALANKEALYLILEETCAPHPQIYKKSGALANFNHTLPLLRN